MVLQDRIFTNFKEAVETFIRMGFEFNSSKQLVLNGLQVVIRPIGTSIWRTSVETLECRPVPNKLLNPAHALNASEEFTQKAEVSCAEAMNEPIDMQQKSH